MSQGDSSRGNLCSSSTTDLNKDDTSPATKCCHYLHIPAYCLWNAVPYLLLCSSSYYFFCTAL